MPDNPPHRDPGDPFGSIAAVLARLDERTERIDRDMRQIMEGQKHHMEAVEARIDQVHDIAQEANRMAKEHRRWITGITSAILLAVIGTILAQIGVS